MYSPVIQPIYDRLTQDNDPLAQIQAAYELGNFQNTSETSNALKALLQGLSVADQDVRLTILDVLMGPDFFGPQIVDRLIEILEVDKDLEVRKQTVEMLGSIKDKRAVKPLIQRLDDEAPEIRHCAMASLANTGDHEALPFITTKLSSDDWEDRFFAVDAVGMFGNEKSIPGLVNILGDPHPRVRENAAISVGHFNVPAIREKLIQLISEGEELEEGGVKKEEGVIGAAIYTLGEFKCKEAVMPIINFLRQEKDSAELVLVSIEALAKIKDPQSIPVLVEQLDSPFPEIYLAVRDALDGFRNLVMLEPLMNAIKQTKIVQYITHRLGKFPNSPPISSLDQKNGINLSNLQLPAWIELFIKDLLHEMNERKKKTTKPQK